MRLKTAPLTPTYRLSSSSSRITTASCRRRRSSEHMIENNAISCRRYLSLSERECRRTSAFCRRSSVPAGDHKFLPPLFVLIAHSSYRSSLSPKPQCFKEYRQCLSCRVIGRQLAVEEAIDLGRAVSVIVGEVARRIALPSQLCPQIAEIRHNDIEDRITRNLLLALLVSLLDRLPTDALHLQRRTAHLLDLFSRFLREDFDLSSRLFDQPFQIRTDFTGEPLKFQTLAPHADLFHHPAFQIESQARVTDQHNAQPLLDQRLQAEQGLVWQVVRVI